MASAAIAFLSRDNDVITPNSCFTRDFDWLRVPQNSNYATGMICDFIWASVKAQAPIPSACTCTKLVLLGIK
jgi:hypothetical protein